MLLIFLAGVGCNQTPDETVQQINKAEGALHEITTQAAPHVIKAFKEVIKPAADQMKAGPEGKVAEIEAKKKVPLGIEGLNYTNATYCYSAKNNNVVCYTEPRN